MSTRTRVSDAVVHNDGSTTAPRRSASSKRVPLVRAPAEVVVAEITADEFAIRPIHYAVGVKLASAYSLTAINASVADLRSLASMLITGT